MFKVLIAILLLTLITFSHAFDKGNVIDRPASKSDSTHRKQPKEKTKQRAYGLSIVGAALPVASAIVIYNYTPAEYVAAPIMLIGFGILMGPSLGQFYAESYGGGLLGFGIRSGGFLLLFIGAIQSINNAFCGFDNPEANHCKDNSDGGPLILLGLLTYVGGVVYSFYDIPKSLENYRREIAEEEFSIAPTIFPTRNGQLQYGIASTLHF